MPIQREILIDAPVEVVWRTVTEPALVRRWFAEELDLVARPGHEGSMTFTDETTGERVTVQVTVRSVDPPRAFSYRWQHPPGTEAREGNSTLVEFTLVPEGEATRLRVVESEVEAMGWSASEQETFHAQHSHGWATYLGRLQDLARSGLGAQTP